MFIVTLRGIALPLFSTLIVEFKYQKNDNVDQATLSKNAEAWNPHSHLLFMRQTER